MHTQTSVYRQTDHRTTTDSMQAIGSSMQTRDTIKSNAIKPARLATAHAKACSRCVAALAWKFSVTLKFSALPAENLPDLEFRPCLLASRKAVFSARANPIANIRPLVFSHTISTLTMFTLLPEKLSTSDPSNQTDPQPSEPPGCTCSQCGCTHSWSLVDVDPVARAQWLYYTSMFGDQ